MTRVYLGLGSNLGDRAANLHRAIDHLNDLADTSIVRHSSFYETAPLGIEDQPPFLNAVAEIETALAPLALLNAAKHIERDLGRDPQGKRWGPRVIDIDIVLWGDAIVEEDGLTAPHPEFRKRAFVLEPLRELAPDAVDPVTGLTVAELAARPEAAGAVRKYEST